MKNILTFSFLFIPLFSFAQSGGHVGKHRHMHQGEAQRPQKFLLKEIEGRSARKLYSELLRPSIYQWKEEDLSDRCSQPVFRIRGQIGGDLLKYECFDRGDNFEPGSRYHCFGHANVPIDDITIQRIKRNQEIKKSYNPCGGNGIVPIDDKLSHEHYLLER